VRGLRVPEEAVNDFGERTDFESEGHDDVRPCAVGSAWDAAILASGVADADFVEGRRLDDDGSPPGCEGHGVRFYVGGCGAARVMVAVRRKCRSVKIRCEGTGGGVRSSNPQTSEVIDE